jgi:hypothetical protein
MLNTPRDDDGDVDESWMQDFLFATYCLDRANIISVINSDGVLVMELAILEGLVQ